MANVQWRTESIKRSKGKGSEGSSNRRKRLWTTVEDLILVDYVRRYGECNWANVQRVTGLTRNGKSCRLRWTDQLHPGLNKEPFTVEEEMLIADLQSQVGNKWSIIAEFLPGRTDNAIKNYWYNRRKKSKMAGLPHDQVTLSSNTIYNGFQLNQENLSPEWIPGSEFPMTKDSESPLYHLPVNYNLKPEPIEFSSIQHDSLHYSSSSAQNVPSMMNSEGWFPPPDSNVSSCFMEEAYPLNDLTTECDGGLFDPIQTEGDLVDLWLKSSSSDEEATAATTTDHNAEFPSWLNSPSLDEFLDQQPICRNKFCTDDEVINNVAVTEESTNCVNSTIINDIQDQEPASRAVGCENSETMIGVEELVYRDDSLDQETVGQDLTYYADYGAIGDFAASGESCVPCYEWDETSDFWSTPFKHQVQMDF